MTNINIMNILKANGNADLFLSGDERASPTDGYVSTLIHEKNKDSIFIRKEYITRFAPSPTGLLHLGNVRTALIAYLMAKKNQGKFMLRIDDTDLLRSKKIYEEQIITDLTWLGLAWDIFARQSERISRYEEVKNKLLQEKRLYACYETAEEIEIKRKMLLSRGLPPIYDRSALKLTQAEIAQFEQEGRKPHYRFLLKYEQIQWHDKIRGEVVFAGEKLSDPILVREDHSMTYILTSVVDDIDFNITHVVRGEDHISNTAVQIQIFEALNKACPEFAHLSLLKTQEQEMSKRTGGFDIAALRDENIEAMAILSLLAKLGTSLNVEAKSSLEELVADFNIEDFGKAPTNYDKLELERLNHKIVSKLEFQDVVKKLVEMEMPGVDENFWLMMRGNLNKISDLKIWWKISQQAIAPIITDQNLLAKAYELFPSALDEHSWGIWTKQISAICHKKGKELYLPLRLALTGLEHGPELNKLLPLIGRERALKRLTGEVA
jgi:glutamyl-tRNA synthetase